MNTNLKYDSSMVILRGKKIPSLSRASLGFWIMYCKCPGKWSRSSEPCWILCIAFPSIVSLLIFSADCTESARPFTVNTGNVILINARDYFQRLFPCAKSVWLIWAVENAVLVNYIKQADHRLLSCCPFSVFLFINFLSSYFPFFGFSMWTPLLNWALISFDVVG